jgi:hypothetical protein
MSAAELGKELRTITKSGDSLLTEKRLCSGSYSGDIVNLSQYLVDVLDGTLQLVETAKRENNPIVLV